MTPLTFSSKLMSWCDMVPSGTQSYFIASHTLEVPVNLPGHSREAETSFITRMTISWWAKLKRLRVPMSPRISPFSSILTVFSLARRSSRAAS